MDTFDFDATIPTNIVASTRERQGRPHYLDQIEGEGAPRRFKLELNQLVMGRADDADIRMPSGRASRRHAFLFRREEEYTICDNGSRNGILLNGIKIHSAILREGDIVQVADCVFTYREG